MHGAFQTEENLGQFHFAVLDRHALLEALVLHDLLFAGSDEAFAHLVVLRDELLSPHQLFPALEETQHCFNPRKTMKFRQLRYLVAHVCLHLVFDEAFVNTALAGLNVPAESLPVVSAGEEERSIQVVIIRLTGN